MKWVVVFVLAVLLMLGVVVFMLRIPVACAWSGTVYIRSDGRVEPVGAPVSTTDGVVYLVWDNISVSGYGCGIVIERDNIILDGRGFSVQGLSMYNPTYGVQLVQRNNVTIKNLIIQEHQIGIIASECVNIRIQANNMVDNFLAIQLSLSNHSTIIGNNITGCISGIVIQDSSNNNVVSENYLMGVGDSATIGTGIGLDGSNNLIMRNTITNYFADGVALSYASANTIYANNITLNGASGINLYEYADNNTVASNIIAGNGYGIYIYQASGNRIYHNNFYKNGENICIDDGVANHFDGGYPAGGNFWDEYSGDDLFHGGKPGHSRLGWNN
jgi:parallel beta-helix repeat protein